MSNHDEPAVGEDRYVLDVDGHPLQEISPETASALVDAGVALHRQVERIAAGERDAIAVRQLIVGLVVALIGIGLQLLGLGHLGTMVLGAGGGVLIIGFRLYRSRPTSVKPYGAKR